MALVVVASDIDAYECYYHNGASNTAPEDDLDAPETISTPVVVTCVAMATHSAHIWDRALPVSRNTTSLLHFGMTLNLHHE